jgi:hypothetical protein
MQIKVVRKEFTEKSTIGELFIDNNFFCYTLEDKVRAETEAKVYGQTAIPKGKYEVIVNYSNRFKQQMPLLLNVKGFEGIRIHKGNTDVDTHGCLLLGKSKSKDFIGLSNVAYNEFMMMLKKATKGEKITIEIV